MTQSSSGDRPPTAGLGLGRRVRKPFTKSCKYRGWSLGQLGPHAQAYKADLEIRPVQVRLEESSRLMAGVWGEKVRTPLDPVPHLQRNADQSQTDHLSGSSG